MSDQTIGLIGYLSRMSLVALVPAIILGIAIFVASVVERRNMAVRPPRAGDERRAFRDYLYTVGAPALWAVAVTAAFNLAGQNTTGQLMILALTAVLVCWSCAHYARPPRLTFADLSSDVADLVGTRFPDPVRVGRLRRHFDEMRGAHTPHVNHQHVHETMVAGMRFVDGGMELRTQLRQMPLRIRIHAVWSRKQFQAWLYLYAVLLIGSTGVLVFNFSAREAHHWTRWIIPFVLAVSCVLIVYLVGLTQLLLEVQTDLREQTRADLIEEQLTSLEKALLETERAEHPGQFLNRP